MINGVAQVSQMDQGFPQALQLFLDVEPGVLGVSYAEGDVLEVAEQRHAGDFGVSCHD